MADTLSPGKSPLAAGRASQDADYARIAASGLFDADFYRATYKLADGEDPLRQFLTSGLAAGRVPSAHFDPALYRLAVADCGAANPLLHYLDHKDSVMLPVIADVFRRLIDKHTRIVPEVNRARPPNPEKLQRHVAYLDRVGDARVQTATINGQVYRVQVPPPEYFFDRLRNEQPFAYVRLTHGFWDGLSISEDISADAQLATLPAAERRALGPRIGLFARPHQACYVEGFYDELLPLLSRHRDDKDFFKAVAFKGFPTADEDLFNPNAKPELRANRLNLMARFISLDERPYDGTLPKRHAFSGHLLELPALSKDRHVIMIGPGFFRDLGARWQSRRYSHVGIPPTLAHRTRWQYLDTLKSLLTESLRSPGPRPLVLLQCGSLAYWLVSKLFDWNPDVFYYDIGQAANIWVSDAPDMPVFEWAHFYDAAAAANFGRKP